MTTARFARVAVVAGLLGPLGAPACRRDEAATPAQMKAQIETLERERDELKARLGDLVTKDPRLPGLPENAVRVGVPTTLARTLVTRVLSGFVRPTRVTRGGTLARTLVTRVLSGFVDSVTLRLRNLKVHKAGKIKKVIPIGEYVLDVAIDEVSGNLKTGQADVQFGGDCAILIRCRKESALATHWEEAGLLCAR